MQKTAKRAKAGRRPVENWVRRWLRSEGMMDDDDIKELFTKFKIMCLKCGSDQVTLKATSGVYYGGRAVYEDGTIVFNCPTCKDNYCTLYQ